MNGTTDTLKSIPENDWSEWSRKIHWALQYAFLDKTSRLKNKEKLLEWKNNCIAVVKSTLNKSPNEVTALEAAAIHFVKHDLVQHYGYKNLENSDKEIISSVGPVAGTSNKACLIVALIILSIIIALFIFLLF